MKTLKTFTTLALSLTLLTGCVKTNNEAIITVNDVAITQKEFNEVYNNTVKNSPLSKAGIDLKNDTSSPIVLMMKERIVNDLIVKSLLEQDMADKKIKATSEEVDKALRDIIDEIGSKEKFNEILRQNGISASQFKKDLENEVKVKKLIDDINVVKVSDKDAEKFYKANMAKFKHPERVKAAHILVSANKDEIKSLITADSANKNLSDAEIEAKVKADLEKKYDKAKKLLEEVKKDPTTFAKVAKENSDDVVSAKQGGDLGYFAREQMVEDFSKAAFALKPSTISEIVVTPYGYHIIMVTDRQEPSVDKFEKVKADIKNHLMAQEKINILQKHVEMLKNKAQIVFVNEEYNPTNIQAQMKQSIEKNPMFNPEAQAAKKDEKK